jgi:dTDP-4-dehydrorhamnose reductase
MLGYAAHRYLGTGVETTDLRWPNNDFKSYIKNYDGDYIINCIGAIPQRTNKFEINYELPIWLEENSNCRIIHPGTDCEMDNDEYGISKSKASRYLAFHGTNTKIIKTSIIGHEINTKASLLDWFLNSEGEVFGYTGAMWNGVTTLQWATECLEMMQNWNYYGKCNVISSECISKYELLNIIKEVYDKDIVIKQNDSVSVNKCLIGEIRKIPIKEQLIRLKEFYNNVN